MRAEFNWMARWTTGVQHFGVGGQTVRPRDNNWYNRNVHSSCCAVTVRQSQRAQSTKPMVKCVRWHRSWLDSGDWPDTGHLSRFHYSTPTARCEYVLISHFCIRAAFHRSDRNERKYAVCVCICVRKGATPMSTRGIEHRSANYCCERQFSNL